MKWCKQFLLPQGPLFGPLESGGRYAARQPHVSLKIGDSTQGRTLLDEAASMTSAVSFQQASRL